MIQLIRILYILSLFAGPAFGQAAAAYAPFSFINCANLPTPVMLKIDGALFRPAGYVTGSFSQGGQLATGSRVLSIENEGAKALTQPVTIQEGMSAVYIGYTVTKQKEDGTTELQLQLAQIPDKAKKSGFRFTGIYVSEKPSCTVYINKKPVVLDRLKPVPLDSKQNIRVSVYPPVPNEGFTRQSPDNLQYNPEDQGDYVVVVFDGPDNKLLFRLVYNTAG